jgi:hypothetical protein
LLIIAPAFGALAVKPRATTLTPIQNLALDLVFEVMAEERINRRYEEYLAIAARLPPLKVLYFKVNEHLKRLHSEGDRRYEICLYKPGDLRVRYRSIPGTISYETLRAALTDSGMRPPRRHCKPK